MFGKNILRREINWSTFGRRTNHATTLLICAILLLPGVVHAFQENLLREAEQRLKDTFFGVVLASEANDIIYQQTFGMADSESAQPNMLSHRFRIGSITKTFTAALIVDLSDDGLLSLDDPISKYVENVPNGDQVTLLHLMEHESGLRDFSQKDWKTLLLSETAPSRDAVLNLITNKKPRRDPGKKFEYNNTGYVLLGFVIEKVTGKTFIEALEERILDPLKLSNTGFVPRDGDIPALSTGHDRKKKIDPADYDYGAIVSAGGLYSDAADLISWCHSKQVNPERTGWRRGERFDQQAVWHPGNTNDYSALIVRFPQIDGCYVVLSNVGGARPSRDILRTLPELFFGTTQ